MKTLTLTLTSFAFLITLLTTSCEKYSDGIPGKSFMSLSWSTDEPDYIETGNSSFPQSFYYDDYYETRPGYYTLYYEGKVWNGYSFAKYAWEIDYEIWVNPGEISHGNYNGLDGADNYFNIDLSPYGPYSSMDNYRKSADYKETIKEISPGIFQIIKNSNGCNIKITYKNVTLKKELR
jgi:hypothetical protein